MNFNYPVIITAINVHKAFFLCDIQEYTYKLFDIALGRHVTLGCLYIGIFWLVYSLTNPPPMRHH